MAKFKIGDKVKYSSLGIYIVKSIDPLDVKMPYFVCSSNDDVVGYWAMEKDL